MRSFILLLLVCSGAFLGPVACVDSFDPTLRRTVDILVVDGRISNLAEPQVIRLNRSKVDPFTDQFGTVPITKANVEVVVDSTQVIACQETIDGSYQLPNDFKGQVGHAYQLRFSLSDGARYVSSQQVIQAVPPINNLVVQFNRTSLPAGLLEGDFRSGYNLLVNTQDPADQRNYYRWDWKLYEKQDWCKSCTQGYYMPNKLRIVSSYPDILIYQTQADVLEDCFPAPSEQLFGGAYTKLPLFSNAYVCRTQCWDIIPNSTLSLFTDANSNGGLIAGRNVGQVPYYTQNQALVEVRQSSLKADAYRYFSLLQQQTQNTGGLADTPPTALIGNVHNVANEQEKVVGYFTAEAISTVRYWLDKKDATGIAYGGVYYDPIDKITKPVPGEQQLFFALNRDLPKSETSLNFTILGGSNRPPTAICAPGDSRTPFKPEGWRD
ncbi:DUF4249 domain-containing protein [Spirosoma arcticum]